MSNVSKMINDLNDNILSLADMKNLEFHEVKTAWLKGQANDEFEIIRVAGGWIYRFTEINHMDGKTFTTDSVFVPEQGE